ncbi:MAG: AAA family ATPase [Planctomycetaceae bacterium]
MRRIAVMNQKGGVGKTTSSVNLAAALANEGRKVCLIDLDPQGHGSLHLGVEPHSDEPSVYDVFSGTRTLREVRHHVADNLWVIPASLDLAATEVELVDAPNREIVLRQAMEKMMQESPVDYVIMDCPPSLGVLTVNALTAADEVFIPLQPHFFALQGLSKLLETTALITRRLNRNLKVSGIMLCLYETGTRLASDVTDDLLTFLRQSPAEAPWAKATVFSSRIRRNIKLAEAPSFGQSIFQYQPKSAGALDYGALATEVIAMEAPVAGLESDISKTFTLPQTPAQQPPGEQRFAA